jgi:hypothetical protein
MNIAIMNIVVLCTCFLNKHCILQILRCSAPLLRKFIPFEVSVSRSKFRKSFQFEQQSCEIFTENLHLIKFKRVSQKSKSLNRQDAKIFRKDRKKLYVNVLTLCPLRQLGVLCVKKRLLRHPRNILH